MGGGEYRIDHRGVFQPILQRRYDLLIFDDRPGEVVTLQRVLVDGRKDMFSYLFLIQRAAVLANDAGPVVGSIEGYNHFEVPGGSKEMNPLVGDQLRTDTENRLALAEFEYDAV